MAADLEILNPVAQLASQLGVPPPVPERPSSLQGLRLGLYWNRKPGGNYALERVAERLQERFPGMETHFYNARRPIPEDMIRDIGSECDVVVGATAD